MLKNKQEQGLKATIITRQYEKQKDIPVLDDHRNNILNILRDAGFCVEFVEKSCKQCAVIDDEIIWYGDINLLSKESIDGSIMRLKSKEIATELQSAMVI